jgi:hypothetical protein
VKEISWFYRKVLILRHIEPAIADAHMLDLGSITGSRSMNRTLFKQCVCSRSMFSLLSQCCDCMLTIFLAEG